MPGKLRVKGYTPDPRKPWRVPMPRRPIAVAVMAAGSLVLALVASYFFYGLVATSRLDEYGIVLKSLEEAISPSPSSSDSAASKAAPKSASFLESSLLSIYPGDKLNPKYWDQPLWAGTDPAPALGLPDGFEPIDGTYQAPPMGSLGHAFRIRIPIIEVDSEVKDLKIEDLGDSRAYETPKNVVGHIPESPSPGEAGNGWFFGHLETPIRDEGSVFKDLPKIDKYVREGSRVYIILESASGTYLYEVKDRPIVIPQEQIRLYQTSEPVVTLVTCVPPIKYDYRLLVTAKLVGVKRQGE